MLLAHAGEILSGQGLTSRRPCSGIGLLASSAAGHTLMQLNAKKGRDKPKLESRMAKHRITIDHREPKDLTLDLSITRRFWGATKDQSHDY